MSAATWQVRITDVDGRVLGSGVLLDHGRVLTCAHVVADGLAARPISPISIDFPLSISDVGFPAIVTADGWHPRSPSGQGDLAILEFDGNLPTDVVPASIARATPRVGRAVKVFGHQRDRPGALGVWTTLTMLGVAEPRGEWVQLGSSLSAHDEWVEPGFSGGGVVDDESGAVLGVMIAAQRTADSRSAWMVPMEVVARYWLPLGTLLDEPPTMVDLPAGSRVERIVAAFRGCRAMADEARRQQVINVLPGYIQTTFPRSLGNRDTDAIVRSCLRFAGGIRVLARMVRYLEGDTERVQAMERVLSAQGYSDELTEQPQPTPPLPRLPLGDHRRLRDLLLEVSGMQDPDTRAAYFDRFVGHLREDRGIEIDVVETGDPRRDVWELVGTCHRIPAAVRQLVSLLAESEPGHPALVELSLLIEAIYPMQLLVDLEREELIGLVRNASAAQLAAAWQHAGPDRDMPGEEPRDLVGMVWFMEMMASHPGQPSRIFAFAEHLAHQLDDQREGLHRWVDRTAARMRLVRTSVQPICRAARQAPPIPQRSYLMFHLIVDDIVADRYQLTVALQRETEPPRNLDVFDDPAPLALIVDRVSDLLLHRLPRELNYDLSGLTVEFILPRVLITEPVDQWPVKDIIPYLLGSRYRVVLRSFDRLDSDYRWPDWRRKWGVAKTQPPTADTMIFVDEPGGDSSPSQLLRQLRSDTKLVLALGRPPGPSDTLILDEFSAAITAGTPFLIWCREEDLAGELRAALTRSLRIHPARTLPDEVLAWRTGDDTTVHDGHSGSAFGQQLSLLVDDADRLPTQFMAGAGQWRPPSRGPS